jgi:hypothetical protein
MLLALRLLVAAAATLFAAPPAYKYEVVDLRGDMIQAYSSQGSLSSNNYIGFQDPVTGTTLIWNNGKVTALPNGNDNVYPGKPVVVDNIGNVGEYTALQAARY